MCGIAGWIDWQQSLNTVLRRKILADMVKTLEVRGPDDQGVYIKDEVAFGHRRLSVVDPENGAQPMVINVGGNEYVITYNGELYNTPELRQELEGIGYEFMTNCDTEVLLIAYIAYGIRCVEKFNGIFAFGIWDRDKKQLFLARDRIGVKPLFYAIRGKSLVFGSEIKTLLANPMIEPKVDKEGLAEIFMIGPARTPGHGVFCGVEELKAGHMMVYTQESKRITKYWSLESHEHEDDFETTVQKVRELIIDAVNRQLIADVKVCTFLSGGLDSSAITSLAAQYFKKNDMGILDTYSVDYVDNDKYFKPSAFQPNSDAPWVKKMVESYYTRHHQVLVDNVELAKSLPRAAIVRDLPGMADVDTSLYLFSREIKKGATVALSGECADEIFGGYPWFYRDEMINSPAFPWSPKPQIRLEWLNQDIKESMDLTGYVQNRYHEAIDEVPKLAGESKEDARMREIFYLSLTRWMPTLLDRKDRMSMAFGLEVRVPYCDHRIVDYVWNVPWQMKNYQNREKGLMRQALTGILPQDVLWRKKSPYPKTHNPEYLKIVRNWAMDILHDNQSPLLDVVNVDKIKEIANRDLAATNIPWFGQLMGGAQLFAYLIQVNAWMKHYKVQLV